MWLGEFVVALKFWDLEVPENVSKRDWSDYRWQWKRSLKSIRDFEGYLNLSEAEQRAFVQSENIFRIQTTPYYAHLAAQDTTQAVRKIMVPSLKEFDRSGQHLLDPLGENRHRPARRIIHRYTDRVLFLVTDYCSVYCRYCTRKHFTGQNQVFPQSGEYEEALNYIRSHSQVKEVILSGGDPLTLANSRLEKVFSDLRAIDHVEVIRVGSRIPVVNPFRINLELVQMMRKYKPVYLMTHFNHPAELTQQAAEALELCVDHGIPVFNQMVLLKGVNNSAGVVRELSRRLLYLRVKPYYMFQCDPSEGTEHLRTSIEESEQIQRELWGHLSGLAMPNLSIDIPNGGGKVAVVPNFEVSRDEHGRTYKGWDGITGTYKKGP